MIMMRDYGYCVRNGYTSDDYAGTWADETYNQVFESLVECFWGNHMDAPEHYETEIEIPSVLEAELREMFFDAYRECYERYEAELETAIEEFNGNFEEWEIDDTTHDVMERLAGEYGDQLEKLCERDGIELKG